MTCARAVAVGAKSSDGSRAGVSRSIRAGWAAGPGSAGLASVATSLAATVRPSRIDQPDATAVYRLSLSLRANRARAITRSGRGLTLLLGGKTGSGARHRPQCRVGRIRAGVDLHQTATWARR
jgi:hypothetical protein